MKVTISEVSQKHDALQEFMRKQCALVAEYGGNFSVKDVYRSHWFTEYTIEWPDALGGVLEAPK